MRKGFRHSEETRLKMSASQGGERNHNFGKRFSKEHCQKIGEARTGEKNPMFGKHPSEEERQKMSERVKGEKNPMFGKHPSEETRKKMSESHKGRVFSEEHILHLREARAHRVFSEETKLKMSESHKKENISEDYRRKMSEAKQGDKASSWKGGISFEPYCPKFNNEFRERVRTFFGHTCQACGHVWKVGEKKLAVHHVRYNKKVCCDGSKPLFVPVCAGRCHTLTNHNRDYWTEIFTNKIMLEYDGECYLPKVES